MMRYILFILVIIITSCSREEKLKNIAEGKLEYLGKSYALSKAYESYTGKYSSGRLTFYGTTFILTSYQVPYNSASGFDSSIQGQVIIVFDINSVSPILKSGLYKDNRGVRSDTQSTYDEIEIYLTKGLNSYDDFYCEDGDLLIDVTDEGYNFSFEGRDENGNILKFNFKGNTDMIDN
jgi:hypothetical protein